MLKEFKEFALRGNVVDLAIGIIIGAAFTAIVTSLVNDIIMPPIGLLLGGVNFSDFFLVLRPGAEVPGPYPTLAAAQAAGAVTINYGQFINSLITFLIVAFTVFLLVRGMNRLSREAQSGVDEKAEQPTTKTCPYCAETIPVKATRCPHCTSQLEATALG
jgi:large conductance mechanosensitive channel